MKADVLVVGAGPSGSVTAGLLAQRGWSVDLVERTVFPRPKPCGECLNPGAVGALRRTGFLPAVLALSPARIEGWEIRTWKGSGARGLFAPSGRRSTPPSALPGDGAGFGLGVARSNLDHALAQEAVARGARLRERTHVTDVTIPDCARPSPVLVRARGLSQSLEARFVVVADGLRSRLARQLGAIRRAPRLSKVSLTCRVRGLGPDVDVGHLRVGGSTTVGLAAVQARSDLWNATVVIDPRAHREALRGDRKALFFRQLHEAAFGWSEGPELVAGPWSSGPFDWPCRDVVGLSHLMVGDAAGYFDPLTGQGIYRAVRSAELASVAVDRFLRTGDRRALREYRRSMRREVAPGRRIQRLIEHVLKRPRPRHYVFSRLEVAPGSLGALIRVTGDLDPSSTLFRPEFWSPLLRRTSR